MSNGKIDLSKAAIPVVNLMAERRADKITLTVDVGEASIRDARMSQTGRSRIVGGTHGKFVDLGGGLAVTLILIAKR